MDRIHFLTLAGRVVLGCFILLSLQADRAVAQSPRERQMAARSHVDQGNYLMARQQFQPAIDEYQKALEFDPMNSVAKDNIVLCHNNWGNFHFKQKKYDDALKEWQAALQLNPYFAMAKHNIAVMKATLARQGQEAKARGESQDSPLDSSSGNGQGKAGGAQARQDNKEQPSAIRILTPGLKQSQGMKPAAPESSTTEQAAPAAEPSQPPSDYDDNKATAQDKPPSGSSQQSRPTNGSAAPSAPAHPGTSGPPSPAQPAGGSLEDLLAAVEIKIYGHKQADMPVLKRLEKLEMDTAGTTRSGTIKERIDFLRKNYGL